MPLQFFVAFAGSERIRDAATPANERAKDAKRTSKGRQLAAAHTMSELLHLSEHLRLHHPTSKQAKQKPQLS